MMIFDSIRNFLDQPKMYRPFAAVVPFLRDTSLATLTPGRHEIDGERLFAVVHHYQSKPAAEGLWEAHRRYYDIQLVTEGVEEIIVAPIETVKKTTEYDAGKDVQFFSGKGQPFRMEDGLLMILGPQDVHMPGTMATTPSAVKKVVLKYLVDSH